jgi:tetratricopeptide (TPR) repeat protein
LNRLSEECVAVLTLAAVIGRQFDFGLLNNLSEDISEFKLLELVDEALEPNILQEVPGQRDRYQFSHALVQQTLLERLSTSRKVRMHAKIGEELETLYDEHPGEHAAELAYHFSEASPLIGPEKFVKYTWLAGENVLAAHAWEEAIERFNAGMAVDSALVEVRQTADLLFGLGKAKLAAGRIIDGWGNFEKAFDHYVEADAFAQVVAVAEYPLPFHSGIPNADRLSSRALEVVPSDSQEAGRLWCDYGTKLGMVGNDYPGASKAFQNALSVAQKKEDTNLEARTWAVYAQVNYWHLHLEESIEGSRRAIDLAHNLGEYQAELTARYWGSISMRALGDLRGVRNGVPDIMAVAERLQDRFGLATAFLCAAIPPLLTGDWSAARVFALKGTEALPNDARVLSVLVNLE